MGKLTQISQKRIEPDGRTNREQLKKTWDEKFSKELQMSVGFQMIRLKHMLLEGKIDRAITDITYLVDEIMAFETRQDLTNWIKKN